MESGKKKGSLLGTILFGPALVGAGVLVLWENEGRFNFAKAAADAPVVGTIAEAAQHDTFALTDRIDTQIPIEDKYLEPFIGYHRVTRDAEIYCWDKRRKDDRDVWDLDWHSSVDSNSRNSGVRQTLAGDVLLPKKYQVGELTVASNNIHFADGTIAIQLQGKALTKVGSQNRLRNTGGFLVKGSLANPKLGDERLSYTGIPNAPTATYFGRISGELATGKQFDIEKSWISSIIGNDGVLHHVVNGERTTAIATMQGYFNQIKWWTRLGGTVAVVLGFLFGIGSVASLLYPIPVLGRIVEGGVFVVSVVLGVTLSTVVIAVSAVFHSVIFLVLALLLVVAIVGWLVYSRRRSKANAQSVIQKFASQTPGVAESSITDSALAGSSEQTFELSADLTENFSGWPTSFSYAETTFGNLARLAFSDGLSKRESQFLSSWGTKNGIAKSRMKEILDEARNSPRDPEAADQREMVLLVALALADGAVSSKEMAFLRSMGGRLGIAKNEIRQMVIDVGSGKLATSVTPA